MEHFAAFNYINLTILAIIATRIFQKQNERTIVLIILTSLFSLLASFQYLLFNAPDVAITEASIGACLTTIFILRASSSISKHRIHLEANQSIVVERHNSNANYILFFVFLIIFTAFFVKTSFDFPKFLSDDAPIIYNNTIKYYISQTKDFLKFPNIVTAIIVSFRGYDTMIETVVILTAAVSIMAILPENKTINLVKKSILHDKSVITSTVMLIIPFIILFGCYIQAHGEESPGGGFQSGSILACAVISYALTVSSDAIHKFLKNSLLLRIGAFGVLTYFTVGMISVLKNQNFLNYNYFLCSEFSKSLDCFSKSQKAAIFLAELGVGMTVFAVMSLIFFNLKIEKQND